MAARTSVPLTIHQLERGTQQQSLQQQVTTTTLASFGKCEERLLAVSEPMILTITSLRPRYTICYLTMAICYRYEITANR